MTDTIYSKTANRLRRKGWVQGWYATANGSCLVGALEQTAYTMNISSLAATDSSVQARQAIKRHLGLAENLAVEGWNDAPHRTLDDVLGLLGEMHEKELAQRGLLAGDASAP